jgi:hypothetical protein
MDRSMAWRGSAVVAVVMLALLSPVGAQMSEVELHKALDKPVDFEVADAPIGEVFRGLSQRSGVPMEVDPDTLELLPYGAQTRLRVRLKNIPVRAALTDVLARQSLRWTIDKGRVRIVPADALYRLCRRATFGELSVLGRLYAMKLDVPEEGLDVLAQLRESTETSNLSNLTLSLRIPASHGDEARAIRENALGRARQALPCTGAEWLDRMCLGQDWTWYVEGERIVVLPKVEQLARQLGRDVTLRYRQAKLQDVLFELAREGRFRLIMEPGVMTHLAPHVAENVNLIASEMTIDEVLEGLSGATGLEFTKTPEGLRVSASDALKGTDDGSSRPRSPFFVKMSVPLSGGATAEVFVRGDELPEEIVERIERQKLDLIERLRPASASPPGQ